ncbi:MAG TPA: hypothetical protein VLV83_13030 [Acidobacteriota bacterium]|nr:hypothetical protein [Acidobacteriota bacterium]
MNVAGASDVLDVTKVVQVLGLDHPFGEDGAGTMLSMSQNGGPSGMGPRAERPQAARRLLLALFMLLALLLPGCRLGAPEALPQEEIEMVLRLLPGGEESPPQAVEVEITVEARDRIKTIFLLEESWAAVQDARDAIQNVRAYGGDGRPLEAFRSQSHGWEIIHRRDEKVRLVYQLDPVHRVIGSHPSQYYRVLLTDDLFQMIGHVGLLYPEHVDKGLTCRFSVRWEGFREAGWKTVSSLSSLNQFQVRTSLSRFINSIFLAGKLRLHPRFIEDNLVQFAVYGEWSFDDSEFVALASRIIKMERDFFRDHSQDYFLVSLIPTDKERGGNMGGTGLTDSFALWVYPGLELESQSDGRTRMLQLLAHEIFHNWNGGKIAREEPEQLIYWFSEGFTDFYARRLLYREGLISREQYAALLSRRFAEFWLSPVNREPNSRIVDDFWKDPQIKDLPYHRGDVVALLLDHEIRRQSGGTRSLDDLMRQILRRYEDEQVQYGVDNLLDLFAQATSPQFAQHLREVIVDGHLPDVPSDLGAPELALRTRQLGAFDPGFDIRSSIAAREVLSVRSGSRAHQAGVREGQKLLGWSVRFGDIDFPITLSVRDGSGSGGTNGSNGSSQRRITYLPQSPQTVPVPSFEAAP